MTKAEIIKKTLEDMRGQWDPVLKDAESGSDAALHDYDLSITVPTLMQRLNDSPMATLRPALIFNIWGSNAVISAIFSTGIMTCIWRIFPRAEKHGSAVPFTLHCGEKYLIQRRLRVGQSKNPSLSAWARASAKFIPFS
jgi:hypothetical protein